MKGNGIRHFLDLADLPAGELRGILDRARDLKRERDSTAEPLAGRTLAMIFDRPSTRTRVSFHVGMRELGGNVITLTGDGPDKLKEVDGSGLLD